MMTVNVAYETTIDTAGMKKLRLYVHIKNVKY